MRTRSLAELVTLAQTADAAGVDSLWVSETPFGWDAFALLGHLAAVTQRVRLGTGVTSPYLRPPHLLAMAAATLDQLSQGRAFLGLGRGLRQWHEKRLGQVVPPPASAMSVAIDLLRQWWRPPYTASGATPYPVRELARYGGGVQPHLPIYVATVGPRMLRVATRQADGLIFTWPSLPYLRQALPRLRAQVAEAGRDPAAFSFIVTTGLEVTPDPAKALPAFKREMALFFSVPGLARVIEGTGYNVARIVAETQRALRTLEILDEGGWTDEFNRRGDFEAAAAAIPDGLAEQTAIYGNAAAVRRRLQEYAEMGVTHLFVPPPSSRSAAEYAAFLASIQPRQ